jgi:hypothetical protein
MEVDEDAPPELVETSPADNHKDEKQVKVPITIVTGTVKLSMVEGITC